MMDDDPHGWTMIHDQPPSAGRRRGGKRTGSSTRRRGGGGNRTGRSGASGRGGAQQVPSPPLEKHSPPNKKQQYSPRTSSSTQGRMTSPANPERSAAVVAVAAATDTGIAASGGPLMTNPNSGSRGSSRAASRDGDYWRASSSAGITRTGGGGNRGGASELANGREKEERLTEQLRAALTSSERDRERDRVYRGDHREMDQRSGSRARGLLGSRSDRSSRLGSPSFGYRGGSAGIMSSGGFDFIVGGRGGTNDGSGQRRAGTAGSGSVTHSGGLGMRLRGGDPQRYHPHARPMFNSRGHDGHLFEMQAQHRQAAQLAQLQQATQQSNRHEDHKARQLNEQLKHALMMSGDDGAGAGSDRGSVNSRDGNSSPGGHRHGGKGRMRDSGSRGGGGGGRLGSRGGDLGGDETDFFFSTASAQGRNSSPNSSKRRGGSAKRHADGGGILKKNHPVGAGKNKRTGMLFTASTPGGGGGGGGGGGSKSARGATKRQLQQRQHLQTQKQRLLGAGGGGGRGFPSGSMTATGEVTTSTTSTTLDARRRYRQRVMGRRAESAHFARQSSSSSNRSGSGHGGGDSARRSKRKSSRKKRNQSADIIRHRQRLRRAALLQRPPSRQRSPFPTHLAEFEFKRFHAFGNKPGGGTVGAAVTAGAGRNRVRMNGNSMGGIMPMDPATNAGLMGPRKMYQPTTRNIDEESPRPPSRHRPPSSNLHLHSEDNKNDDEGIGVGAAVVNRGARGDRRANTVEDLVVDEQEPDEGSEIVAGSGRAVVKGSNQTQSLFMSTTVGGTHGDNNGNGGFSEQDDRNMLGQDLYDLTLEPPREHAIPIQITTRTRDGGHAITSTTTLEVAKLHMKKLALEQKKRLKRLEKKSKKKKKKDIKSSAGGGASGGVGASDGDKKNRKKEKSSEPGETNGVKTHMNNKDVVHSHRVDHSPRAQEVDVEEEGSDSDKIAIYVNSDEEEHFGRSGVGGFGEDKAAVTGGSNNPLSLNLATMKRQPSQASLESQRNQRLALQEYEQALISSRTTPRRLHSSSSSRRPARSNSDHASSGKNRSLEVPNTHAGGRPGKDYNVHDGVDGQGQVPGSSRKSRHTAKDFGFTGDHPDERAEKLSEQHAAFMRAQTADVGELNHATSSTSVDASDDGAKGGAGAQYRPPLTAYADVPDPISNPRIVYSEDDEEGHEIRTSSGGDGSGRSDNRRASSREARDHERRKERRRRRRRHRNSRRNYDEVDDADTELREWERQMANNSGGGSLPTSAGSSNHPTPRGGGAGGEGWFEELFGGRDEGGRASSDDASSFYSSHSDGDAGGRRQRQQQRHGKRNKTKKKTRKKKKKKKKKKGKRDEVEELFSGGAGPNTSRSSRLRGRDEWSLSSQSL